MTNSPEITFDMVTTKGGDKGNTSLYDGTRVPKNDNLIHFLGTMDTFTSFLGLAKAKTNQIQFLRSEEVALFIENVQQRIIYLNGMAASPHDKKPGNPIVEEDIHFLEEFEKSLMEKLQLKPQFIIQGMSELSATYDVARTFCREAERRIVELIFDQNRRDLQTPQKFLNRLADVIYIIARFIDQNYIEK
ncbi:cob(I)yrinic acid a,c-diamide adenosyltransferase [Candidatus Lokiarchaeum ossiferum]|uniref:cob(I)yrinic acid a,c-diamide adenosyltransferase n=1 Tax=Candidatus Lokiarchaeum ossiferum TaxID=2951803 RepID=UPI00352C148D